MGYGSPGDLHLIQRSGESLGFYEGARSWDWGPDGELYDTREGEIYLAEGNYGSARAIDVDGLEASPDGEILAFAMDGHVWTIGIDGAGRKQLTVSCGSNHAPAWSPEDGPFVAVLTEATCPEVHVVAADGERVHIAEPAVETHAVRLQKRVDDGDTRNACAFSRLSWRPRAGRIGSLVNTLA